MTQICPEFLLTYNMSKKISDIQQLERTRESMARELVNLTNQNEEIMEKIEELPLLKKQYEELNQRYDALLQMYGEKVEEADELRLDLQDVKEMYKLQVI
uniref:TATA element modulatory factor n=1 Tax=Magallana gigas TaxID=29159 RepID=K1Q536_MAGGI